MRETHTKTNELYTSFKIMYPDTDYMLISSIKLILMSGFPFLLQVACMQFINIVVHSVEDMNFRVHLQYEFTKLGLDDFLEVKK